jgi:hypothetical protein
MDYNREFGMLIEAMKDNGKTPRLTNMLIGPSLATGDWTPEMMWDTGFISSYLDNLYALSVEQYVSLLPFSNQFLYLLTAHSYPNNNCHAQFGTGSFQDPQLNFPSYLTHNAGIDLCRPYLNSTLIAQTVNKPFIMFETNTASCGGFPGISDSFGAALWAMDYGYQMAYSNFSNALFHIGGQNVYYNPFTGALTLPSLLFEQSELRRGELGRI